MQDFLDLKNKEDDFFLSKVLYVVSTPIGNMMDITLRAIDSLKRCDVVICEDSRVSGRLLNFLKIKKPLIIYNDYSDESVRKRILDLIKNQNKALCLISDAGTPLISDPGFKLISFLLDNEVQVKSVPGPCSAIAALSICGIESDRFLFAGFIPNLKSQKEGFFKEFSNINSTLIFFESPQRIAATLQIMLNVFGDRKAAIAREITKFYEEVKKDSLSSLVQHYKENKIKGEVVILLSKPNSKDKDIDFDELDRELILAAKKMTKKDAISLVSDIYNLNKKIVYQRMLNIENEENSK